MRKESRPRRSLWSSLLSILLHGVVIGALILAQWREISSWEEILDPGDGAGRGGGGGGGAVTMVAIPAYKTPAPTPAPRPVPPEITPPTPEVVLRPQPDPVVTEMVPIPVELASQPDTLPAAADRGVGGTGSGGGRGSGVGPGEGSGVGPGSGSGTGGGPGGGTGHATPPVPRQVILPPFDYPRDMRGRTFAVTFWVGTNGRVARVVVEPSMTDRGFGRRFTEVMKNYRFRPARSADGTPIPGTTTVTVSF